MNYEKIIVELLGRIQVLEEQMATLLKEKEQTFEDKTNNQGIRNSRKPGAKCDSLRCAPLRSGAISKHCK